MPAQRVHEPVAQRQRGLPAEAPGERLRRRIGRRRAARLVKTMNDLGLGESRRIRAPRWRKPRKGDRSARAIESWCFAAVAVGLYVQENELSLRSAPELESRHWLSDPPRS